jgi:hypothetical protein
MQNTSTIFTLLLTFCLPHPTGTHPRTRPILLSCPSDFKCLLIVQGGLPWYFTHVSSVL